jgi:SHS2 domain-containing protein
MPYRFLPDVALADIAFEAEAHTIDGLFETCATALTDIMVDPRTLGRGVTKVFSVRSENLDRLLYDFLTELIVAKDVDSMLFKKYRVKSSPDGTSLSAYAKGEPINRDKHALRNDVKAVTMHMFGIAKSGKKWKATVVLDV